MKKILILLLLSCNTVEKKESKKTPVGTTINIDVDGSYTVFTRYDSSATFVSQTKDGILLDSTWLFAKPEISDDSLKKDYFRMVQGSKHQ